MISETKIDSFSLNQFYSNVIRHIRLDFNKHNGGTKLYARVDIPIKLLSSEGVRLVLH